MSDELLSIDLMKAEAKNYDSNISYPFYTSMGHLLWRPEDKTLYSFGGLNSSGINYKLASDAKEWAQLDKRHSLIANAKAMDLAENPCVYFSSIEI